MHDIMANDPQPSNAQQFQVNVGICTPSIAQVIVGVRAERVNGTRAQIQVGVRAERANISHSSNVQRADPYTAWKEFTTPEGRKYYYNTVTMETTWEMPEELELAQDQARAATSQQTIAVSTVASQAQVAHAVPARTAVMVTISTGNSSHGINPRHQNSSPSS